MSAHSIFLLFMRIFNQSINKISYNRADQTATEILFITDLNED